MSAHVGNNSGNNEWYTPERFLTSARHVMGSIDFDPASNDIAQKTVRAMIYCTKEFSGLDVDWFGRVWMNPPYSAALIKQFAAKLKQQRAVGNVNEFCVLTNNATETVWFRDILSVSDAVCFLNKRVRFLDPDGNKGDPLQGQVIFYSGVNLKVFIDEFSTHGEIMVTLKESK